ncbi:MAG: AAA family ATPase [Pseudomonadales bacterium]|nr:AAA family ATPase [Pseudomonadales bacterium]
MLVVFIYGPAASGKHTIGELLSSKLGLPLFHNHLTVDLVSTLFEFGTDDFINLRANIWLQSFAAAAQAQQSFIFTFHPEKTVQEDLLPRLQQIIEDYDGAVQYIELVCPDEEVERRLPNSTREQFGKLRDVELYKQLRKAGQLDFSALPDAHLQIDTTRLSAEEAANAIEQHLASNS